MPYQTWLEQAVRQAAAEAGVGFTLVSGWQTRGNSSIDPRVIVVHHDASSTASGNAGALNIIVHGRAGLPGPLANIQLGRNGHIWLVAAGRSNNAGQGSWLGWSGNSRTIGIEAANNGTGEPWSPALIRAYTSLCHAMVTMRSNLVVGRVCGHKEWTTRKIDPRGDVFGTGRDLSLFRQMVQAGATSFSLGDRVLERTDPMMRGDDVKEWQRLINQWADKRGLEVVRSTPRVTRLSTDGVYGDNSRVASSNFVRREMDVDTPNPRIGPKSIARMREVLAESDPKPEPDKPRRYFTMLLYVHARQGVPDGLAGLLAALGSGKAAVSANLEDVQVQMAAGEPVVAVGAPAVDHLAERLGGAWADLAGRGTGRHAEGNLVALRGQTWKDSAKMALDEP